MKTDETDLNSLPPEGEEPVDRVEFGFGLNRRSFVQLISTGLAVAVSPMTAVAQRRGGGGGLGGGPIPTVATRLIIGKDGVITVFTSKVEVGQGARAELTQAAAEELRVPVEQVRMVMADTAQGPDDGGTAGSRSTPATVPMIRKGAAAARNILVGIASQRWGVEPASVEARAGKITHAASNRSLTYAELAQSEDLPRAFDQAPPADIVVTPLKDWRVLGTSVPRPNARDIVTGAHKYPSDIELPGMWRGVVLRQPSYGAKLISVDLAPAKAMKDVIAVQDGDFVGVVAPTTFQAQLAINAIEETAKWEKAPHPASKDLFTYLRDNAQNVPRNSFADEVAAAKHVLKQSFNIPYVQHAPMETRAAVAEFREGKLTVWTGTQMPSGCRGELARALRLDAENVRLIVPDTGGGFGGKHSGETAVEAARLAKAAGKPVSVKWTREDEFTWAYFRPAGVIEIEATLDAKGVLTSWHCVNINSGAQAVESPYQIAQKRGVSVNSRPPLRHGSYRALASTANIFAREAFMDECAAAAGVDPLEFRLAHLEAGRLRAVLAEAAKRFNWKERVKEKRPNIGVGLACGTEKGSYAAACVEIAIDPADQKITVRRVCEAYECGAIINPGNLLGQVQGGIIMGLGPALREAMRFEDGEMRNATFSKYHVPRYSDLPEMDIHLLDRPDLPSVGAGETPIVAVAPAIANAVFHATGRRARELPVRVPEAKTS